jgi:hypothetical protein
MAWSNTSNDVNLKGIYMRRFFSSLFFTIVFCSLFAQVKSDSSKHLSFKGVPINGTLAEYVSKMKKNGFTHKLTKDGIALLEGEFASYKNCSVGVSTLKQKDLVNKIVVLFPERNTWSSLSSNYFNLKDLLTEKYGTPSESVEEFSTSVDDDGSKMIQAEIGACNYHTTYITDKGTIQLKIEHDGALRCYISLAYFDKINGEVVKKQALDDL